MYSGFKPDGTPYKQLNSLQDRMNGLKAQIKELQRMIDRGEFEGEALEAAKGALQATKSQYEDILHLLRSVDRK